MIIRAIDGELDWTFGKGTENYLSGNLAIGQNIATRLRSFLNNCFFDMNAGIDWFTYLGLPNKDQEIKLRTRAIILQSYGVVKINELVYTVDSSIRKATLNYNIDTIFTTQYTQQLEVISYV